MNSTTAPLVLNLRGVGRQFGTDPVIHALRDVDLKVYAGEWLAITGPSGAGKSTLLNIIGCLDQPTAGTYCLDSIDTSKLKDKQRAGLRGRRIGFVFQSFHLLPHRTVLENVMLAEVYRKQSAKGRRARAVAALEKVGLGHRIEFVPTKLSGGERQRVAIARAIVGKPSLLLCDEPTGNLDSKSSRAIMDLFDDLNQQGLTIVVITHDEQVAQEAKRRVNIIDGQLNHVTLDNSPIAPPQSLSSDEASAEPTRKVLRSGMTLRDLINEAVAGMFSRPGRMVLTMLGIVIGLTALVATLGLSRTANNRIISRFDEISSTEIIVTAKQGAAAANPNVIPWDASSRLQRLNGVVAAGTLSEVDIGNTLISASPIKDPVRQTAFKMSVQAASPSLFPAVRYQLSTGRIFDEGHSQRADRVALVGATAAQQLGITTVDRLPAISIGDYVYLVIGIVSDVARQPDLLGSVIIPEGSARRDFGLLGAGSVVIETKVGATQLIVKQTPLALRPDEPDALKVEFPPAPQRVRDAVQSDLNIMFIILGGLSLVVGAIGIANITLVSVIERTGEIGLRRAIGATRQHIARQFLLESTSMGIIGGIVGASLGTLVVVAISAYQVWVPVLDPYAQIVAPIVGGAIGWLSGIYPAMRAARMEPAEAFRTGV